MNHPKREEWVPFLYGETTPEVQRELKAHLRECPECRSEIDSWQQSVRRLDHWKLPRPRFRLNWFAPVLKWGVATALLLGVGFVLGRLAAGPTDIETLRTRLEPQLRESLRQETAHMIREEVSRSSSLALASASEHAEKLLAAYNTIQEARRADDLERLYLAIKKQLDIVAINTQEEFVQLAGYTRPAEKPQ